MAGYLGKTPLTSDIALFLEVAVIIALFFGRYKFARKGRIKAHSLTVTAATALHPALVLLVMIPSLAESANILFNFFSPIIIIT